MKKTIIAALLVATNINITVAKDLLTDGKRWNCVERMYNDLTGEFDRQFSIVVVGDTIVNGTYCKRMEQIWLDGVHNSIHFAAIERYNRVYTVTDDGEDEFLNFNLTVGDADRLSGYVVAVDQVMVGNVSLKRITINRDGHMQYIVEGIGLSDDWNRDYIQTSFYTVVLSVEEQGVQIFTSADFTQGVNGIHSSATQTDNSHMLYYDLSGKCVDRFTRGILISGNCKKVRK